MTVVVAILCTDGVVIASDSMITNSMGSIGTTETKGTKIYDVKNHVFAFAGDQALADRFRAVLEHGISPNISQSQFPIDYAITATRILIGHFTSTSLNLPINLSSVIAFIHSGDHHCAIFNVDMQPRFLDTKHYWFVFGSGKQFADPFLAFLTGIFCVGQPSISTGKFIATWAVQHAIETNTGGVNGPIQMYVLAKEQDSSHSITEMCQQDIDDQYQAIEDARAALVEWRDQMSGELQDENLPPVPQNQ
jgi:20S proteasome alpha/beta subunit